jgi:hypothetical protein
LKLEKNPAFQFRMTMVRDFNGGLTMFHHLVLRIVSKRPATTRGPQILDHKPSATSEYL